MLSHIKKNLPNVAVVAEKIDDGFSGATFQRQRFIEMMEEVRAEEINCIIVKDLSRFGRNFSEYGKYIEHVFPFLGVRFISVNDGYDNQTPGGKNEGLIIALKSPGKSILRQFFPNAVITMNITCILYDNSCF